MPVFPDFRGHFIDNGTQRQGLGKLFHRAVSLAIGLPMGYHPHLERAARAS
jgi:hypothetical protein